MIINPFKVNNDLSNVSLNEDIDLKELQKYLIENNLDDLKDENRKLLTNIIEDYLYTKYSLNNEFVIKETINRIFDKIFGYDILQKYIDNPDITDIRAVKYDSIYVKNKGKWKKEECKFESEEAFY